MKTKLILFLTLLPIATHTKHWETIPLAKLLAQNPSIHYQKCFDPCPFAYKKYPHSYNPSSQPNGGYFKETFILTIPDGKVQSYGMVTVDNKYIQEMIWKNFEHNLWALKEFNDDQTIRIAGRVAVIGQAAHQNYFHWITEILCRLALLELAEIEYDYLYVPQDSHFMIETLQLWGIDPEKIITPQEGYCIQAQTIILPSMVSNTDQARGPLFSCYVQPHLIKYVKDKLLTAAQNTNIDTRHLSKRIFVSRKDAPQRQILNEDEVFALFEPLGFVRYQLSKLSVVEQILLFANAEIIVSPQGTGLANTIFCTKKVKIIELLQGLNDCTFWYLSQTLDLNYSVVQTVPFFIDYMTAWKTDTTMPLPLIEKIVDALKQGSK
jgi:capsular polysaccharide biosynthesis protein